MKMVILSMVLGYLLGCLNPAYCLGKARGFDIRERGTNNPGATNALVSMGLPMGILVVLLDIGKAMLSMLLASQLCQRTVCAKILAGFCCTLGHVFPAPLKFRGGRGTACLAGVVLYLTPSLFLPMALGAFVLGMLCDRASLLPPLAALLYPGLYAIFIHAGREALLLCLFIPLLFWTHRKNLSKYQAGREIGFRSFFFGSKKDEMR